MLHLSSDKLCVFRTHGLASQISSDKLCVLVTWSSVPNYCSFFRISFVLQGHTELLQLSSDKFCVSGTWSSISYCCSFLQTCFVFSGHVCQRHSRGVHAWLRISDDPVSSLAGQKLHHHQERQNSAGAPLSHGTSVSMLCLLCTCGVVCVWVFACVCVVVYVSVGLCVCVWWWCM